MTGLPKKTMENQNRTFVSLEKVTGTPGAKMKQYLENDRKVLR
jgi:hypothetical protein